MFLLIRDKLKCININIDDIVESSVYNGIIIKKRNNYFYIELENNYIFDDEEKVKRLEIKKYLIKKLDNNEEIELYVYQNDEGFNNYELYSLENFLCASYRKANIENYDNYMNNYYIYFNNGYLDTNFPSLTVNDIKYRQNNKIKNGDRIRFQNLIIIFFNNYLYINGFLNKCLIKKANINGKIIKYLKTNYELNNSFNMSKTVLSLPELKEFIGYKKQTEKNLTYQIGPSITMSLSMFALATINIYNNFQKDFSFLNILMYLLMPSTMLLSGVLWPTLSNKNEKKKLIKENVDIKNNYLEYLDKFFDDTKKLIKEYITNETRYYFSKKYLNRNMFSITSEDDRFLDISVGKISLNEEYIFKKYNDQDIDNKLRSIENYLNSINEIPFYLNMLEYKKVSVICEKYLKEKIIKKYLTELSFKYDYEKFYIGIYSENIENLYDLFGIPQLIMNNNRLTYNKKIELQELNNLKINRPLILFICDKIEVSFSNKDIHIIYFSESMNDICKNSDILVEYQKEYGFIYQDRKIPFKYELDDLNYKALNNLFCNFQKIEFVNKIKTIKDINNGLNIEKNYNEKQIGLKAFFSSVGEDVLSFDLHESKQGPHGLIGGSTGSGKSELIISLLLSLCLKYRPDYLNIIIIDYKGGGLKDSLSYKNKTVPHVIASIDNLESDIFNRLIIAIDNECKKRQKLFKNLSSLSFNSIMSIDDYLNGDYLKYNLPSIAHLLIVVDEFAELKKENPEIIKELVSFSRIGRSLGIHLILATQRPNGTIDDEIWSNSHFKIALKVHSEKDSNDIIKNTMAAYLSNPGEFYLSVDDSIQKATSAYSKKDINDNDSIEISILDNTLNIDKQISIKNKEKISEASYIVNRINGVSEKLNIYPKKLNFYKPNKLRKEELLNKYENNHQIILGEVDDYINFSNSLLSISSEENTFIFSTRDNEINLVLNSLSKRTVVIGSERYETSKISDSLLYEEVDDILFLFKNLINSNPNLTLIVEDISCLFGYDENFSSYFYQILRKAGSSNVNIIAISKVSLINIKILSLFKNKYIIEMSDKQDLLNIFGTYSRYIGESYYLDNELKTFVPVQLEKYKYEPCFTNPYIKHIPSIIKYKRNINGILLGYDKETRKEIYLLENENLIISSYNERFLKFLDIVFRNENNILVVTYDKNINFENNKIMWVGDGLLNQKIFYANEKEDLKNDEAYIYKGNKGTIIKVINSE